jgi:hypothetical protein
MSETAMALRTEGAHDVLTWCEPTERRELVRAHVGPLVFVVAGAAATLDTNIAALVTGVVAAVWLYWKMLPSIKAARQQLANIAAARELLNTPGAQAVLSKADLTITAGGEQRSITLRFANAEARLASTVPAARIRTD